MAYQRRIKVKTKQTRVVVALFVAVATCELAPAQHGLMGGANHPQTVVGFQLCSPRRAVRRIARDTSKLVIETAIWLWYNKCETE